MVMSRNPKPFDCLGRTMAHGNAGISPPLIGFKERFGCELFPTSLYEAHKNGKKAFEAKNCTHQIPVSYRDLETSS